VDAIDDGECTLIVPFQKAFERPGGAVSGPVFMAVADAAMWFAIVTRLGARAPSVTSELNTAFLNPARQEDIRCNAKILKMGKRLIYGVADCIGATSGHLLTHHTITYMRLDT